jgi:hypothetical protein
MFLARSLSLSLFFLLVLNLLLTVILFRAPIDYR